MENKTQASALTPTVVNGVKFSVKRSRRFEWLVAKLDKNTFLLSYENTDFFKGWAFSVTDETGRPIISSVGQTYYASAAEAFAVARASF